jgi:PAS domain S-box-containing protein
VADGEGSGNKDLGLAELIASIRHSPIATVVTDNTAPDNPIVAVNTPFGVLTGFSPDEVLGRNCRFLSGPDTEPARRQLLREAVAAGRPVLTELTNYRKDGSTFLNAVMIAPVRNEAGEVLYHVGSQMDVGGSGAVWLRRRQDATALVERLTERQRSVLALMILGLRNKQIAARLGINEATVKLHRSAMLAKLDAATSSDAIRIGLDARLGDDAP